MRIVVHCYLTLHLHLYRILLICCDNNITQKLKVGENTTFRFVSSLLLLLLRYTVTNVVIYHVIQVLLPKHFFFFLGRSCDFLSFPISIFFFLFPSLFFSLAYTPRISIILISLPTTRVSSPSTSKYINKPPPFLSNPFDTRS